MSRPENKPRILSHKNLIFLNFYSMLNKLSDKFCLIKTYKEYSVQYLMV